MPRPANALIIDDESHVRTFLRVLLTQLGITQFWEARDGAAGLALVREHRPELVLLDINLPLMSGLDVLRELRSIAAETPVIMVSSQSAIKTVQEALELGAIAYVLKHGSKDQALETIREALDSLDEPAGDEDAP